MSTGSGENRWWESYLVRYFMPSIAGVAIVSWLGSIAGDEFRYLLLLPANLSEVNTSTLLLLFLYGNLFCYIASYPVLSFHATRAIDFKDTKWPVCVFRDGYITTLMLAVSVFLLVSIDYFESLRYETAILFAIVFSGVQLRRLYLGME